jgi:hypothetical protein
MKSMMRGRRAGENVVRGECEKSDVKKEEEKWPMGKKSSPFGSADRW